MTRLPLILAIDPALSCGWAIGDVGPGGAGLISAGVWSRPASAHPGDRFIALYTNLVRTTELHHAIAQLVYETGFAIANTDRPLERDNKGPRTGFGTPAAVIKK